MTNDFYFYTESAFIHQGDVDYMLKLVKASAEAGANGIKFQVILDYDAVISKANPNYESFKVAMITKSDWEKIFLFTKECGLDIIMILGDIEVAKLVNNEWKHFVKYIDIAPAGFIYQPSLDYIKQSNIDVIMGVGGRTKNEIDEKLAFFGDQVKVLMFGHQAFPTQLHQSAIGKIPLLAKAYPNLTIGYADHTPYASVWSRQLHSIAYMLGARCYEKHIGLVEGEERFDYMTASSVESLKNMIADMNELAEKNVEIPFLDKLNPSETRYTSRQVKAVAARNMEAGEILAAEDLRYKMFEGDMGFDYNTNIVGKKLLSPLQADFPFTADNIA
jgi:N,N'-diacetyllegionaminate synthase